MEKTSAGPQGAAVVPLHPPEPGPVPMVPATFKLSYVDFIPQCLQRMGFMVPAKYERFDVLMSRANDWLAANPEVKVRNCESLELNLSHVGVDSEKSVYTESGSMSNFFIRALRLWIASKEPGDAPEPVRLGWLNVVPACTSQGGFIQLPQFDSFDVTMAKLNDMMRAQPLPGKIINLETQEMKFTSWKAGGVDCDECHWAESGEMSTFYLMIIRVFYQAAPPAMESVGSVDIAPGTTSSGLSLTSEPYGVIAERANQWIQQHPGIRVTNIQSINYKLDTSFGGGQNYDTLRTLYRKSGDMTTIYIRMIRIYFAQPFDGSASAPQGAPPVLTYRSFVPAVIRPSGKVLLTLPKYETMSQNMARLVAWLNLTGAKVIGAETMTCTSFFNELDPEKTHTYSSGRTTNVWVYIFRLYLDGYYSDPPPEALPPLPAQEPAREVGCCTIT